MKVSKEYFAKQIEANGRQSFEMRLSAYLANDDSWGFEEICEIVLNGYKGLSELTDTELAEKLFSCYSSITIEEFEGVSS